MKKFLLKFEINLLNTEYRKLNTFLVFTLCLCASVVKSDTHYVSKKGSNTPPYTTLETAARVIQDAVFAATDGDTVLVNDGTYYLNDQILITKSLLLKSINGSEKTIVDGGYPVQTIRCFYLNNENIIIDGLTIANGCSKGQGGGLFCESVDIIKNCVITKNNAEYKDQSTYGRGGGVYFQEGGTISNCVIINNTSDYSGGGIYCYKTEILDCVVTNNTGLGVCRGSAICATDSLIKNCNVSYNFAKYDWDGVRAIYSNSSIIENCKIIGNQEGAVESHNGSIIRNCIISANYDGDAVWSNDSFIRNCTITANSGGSCGGILCSDATLQNNIIYYNHGSVATNWISRSSYEHSVFKNNCTIPLPDGKNNISNLPKLTDSGHIAFDSPCVGAGNNNFSFGKDFDNDEWKNPPAIGCDQPNGGSVYDKLEVEIKLIEKTDDFEYGYYFNGVILGHATKHIWSFGDGTTLENEIGGYHVWEDHGSFDVILTAFNDAYINGIAATVTLNIAESKVHYVNIESENPVSPYLTWETAATNIQDAVDVAVDSERILVTNGIYYLSNSINVTNNLIIKSINGSDVTIVDGNRSNICFYLSWLRSKGGTIIDGFTVRNGSGGIHALMEDIIQNCVITKNHSGGIYCSDNVSIKNCVITENTASSGGGVYINGANKIQNCIITKNCAIGNGGSVGGGLCFGLYSMGTIINCLISENTAQWGGGGCYIHEHAHLLSKIINSTICKNKSIETQFDGVYCGIKARIINSIIYSHKGEGLWFKHGFGNRADRIKTLATYTKSCRLGRSPGFVDIKNNSFRLKYRSPCVNKGTTNFSFSLPETDLAGNPRIMNGKIDIGAYECNRDIFAKYNIKWNKSDKDKIILKSKFKEYKNLGENLSIKIGGSFIVSNLEPFKLTTDVAKYRRKTPPKIIAKLKVKSDGILAKIKCLKLNDIDNMLNITNETTQKSWQNIDVEYYLGTNKFTDKIYTKYRAKKDKFCKGMNP